MKQKAYGEKQNKRVNAKYQEVTQLQRSILIHTLNALEQIPSGGEAACFCAKHTLNALEQIQGGGEAACFCAKHTLNALK